MNGARSYRLIRSRNARARRRETVTWWPPSSSAMSRPPNQAWRERTALMFTIWCRLA
jgi:hypothetical protein